MPMIIKRHRRKFSLGVNDIPTSADGGRKIQKDSCINMRIQRGKL